MKKNLLFISIIIIITSIVTEDVYSQSVRYQQDISKTSILETKSDSTWMDCHDVFDIWEMQAQASIKGYFTLFSPNYPNQNWVAINWFVKNDGLGSIDVSHSETLNIQKDIKVFYDGVRKDSELFSEVVADNGPHYGDYDLYCGTDDFAYAQGGWIDYDSNLGTLLFEAETNCGHSNDAAENETQITAFTSLPINLSLIVWR